MTDNANATSSTTQPAAGSTLIEFPGVNRKPAWRKELSERFREIQQRRAREAALDDEHDFLSANERGDTYAPPAAGGKAADAQKASSQLGHVPTPDEPEMNPLVAAALRRIERARSQHPAAHVTRGGSQRGAATAAARVVEEHPETYTEEALAPRSDAEALAPPKRAAQRAEPPQQEAEQARTAPLVVVSPARTSTHEPATVKAQAEAATVESSTTTHAVEAKAAVKEEPKATPKEEARPAIKERADKERAAAARAQHAQAQQSAQAEARQEQAQSASKQTRHISGVLDEFWLERQGIELLPKVAEPELSYDDRAPRAKRIAAAVVDLLVVVLICAPFAAAIELTISNWGDPRVWGSMAGIGATAMFLYHTCAVALAGRTLGMSLCSLHAVDARKACVPTTGQCARRALVYMLSLATLGVGLLYSLFDAEGRTAHDILSGTVVVKQ